MTAPLVFDEYVLSFMHPLKGIYALEWCWRRPQGCRSLRQVSVGALQERSVKHAADSFLHALRQPQIGADMVQWFSGDGVCPLHHRFKVCVEGGWHCFRDRRCWWVPMRARGFASINRVHVIWRYFGFERLTYLQYGIASQNVRGCGRNKWAFSPKHSQTIIKAREN
jgi:hypothetical protein